MPLLVFTDLDGSLMEHESYSIEPARAALHELHNRDIRLILNSSKTAAEIKALQTQHNLPGPFICENGAALYESPGVPTESFGTAATNWLPAVHSLRRREAYKFSGFSDWSPAQIANLTGLSPTQAALAKQRHYSEPILWQDSQSAKTEFLNRLSKQGLQLLEGGRFLSIQSHYDKSDAMTWLTQKLSSPLSPLISIALGDSPNDEAMLNSADIAVIIKSAKSDQVSCPNAKLTIKTSKPGPAGWNQAIFEILSLYDTNQLIHLS
ncbi:MAG: mannosyl-3-phosphoglycerate phosphatase [Pseudohongiellaceae bacterium]|jgi:mannosyl-3-phosphoglycerate phosphatase